MTGRGPRVLTVLRGPQPGAAPPASPAPVRIEPARPTTAAAGPAPPAETMSIYGVPASAVQHCCGRGCRHCRIFWHGKKP